MKHIAAGAVAVVLTFCISACGEDSLHSYGDDDLTGCAADLDCDLGSECIAGECIPVEAEDPVVREDPPVDPPVDPPPVSDPPPEEEDDPPVEDPEPVEPTEPLPLFVGGEWDTTYHLDWTDYLGPLGDLGTPLDFIDQVLLDNIDLPFIDAIIDNYVPDWVGDLVGGLNNIVHFFQDVRIEARMDLMHVAGSPNQITGAELWQSATVAIIDQCPLGEMDPGYPGCADFTVPLNQFSASFGTISAVAEPFSGWVGDVNGDHEIQLPDREVQMEIAKFVTAIVDFVTNLASGGQFPTLGDALAGLIDCPSLTAALENALGTPLPGVTPACNAAVSQVVDEMYAALDAIAVDWEVMQFDLRAPVFDDDIDGNADRLGAPPQDAGLIENGEFTVLYDVDMPGSWFGTRP